MPYIRGISNKSKEGIDENLYSNLKNSIEVTWFVDKIGPVKDYYVTDETVDEFLINNDKLKKTTFGELFNSILYGDLSDPIPGYTSETKNWTAVPGVVQSCQIANTKEGAVIVSRNNDAQMIGKEVKSDDVNSLKDVIVLEPLDGEKSVCVFEDSGFAMPNHTNKEVIGLKQIESRREIVNREQLKRALMKGEGIQDEKDVKDLRNYRNCRELYYAAARGCLKNKNTDVLTALYSTIVLELGLLNRNKLGSDFSKEELIEKIEDTGIGYYYDDKNLEDVRLLYQQRVSELDIKIMRPLTIAAIEINREGYDPYVANMVHELSTNENRDVRLYYCANCDKPSRFLQDEDERIRKVASIRTGFAEKWQNMSKQEQEDIMFLSDALENGDIKIMDGLVGQEQEEGMLAKFSSDLFEEKSTEFIPFDEDIVKNIGDRRILAYYLNNMVSQEKIHLKKELKKDIVEPTISAEPKREEKSTIDNMNPTNLTSEELLNGIYIMKNRLATAKKQIVEETKKKEELLSQKNMYQNYINLYKDTLAIENEIGTLTTENDKLRGEVNQLMEEAGSLKGRAR